MKDYSFVELGKAIFHLFNTDIFSQELTMAFEAYSNFDNPNNPCPLVKSSDNIFFQELWHGPSGSFNDLTIQPFASLVSSLAKRKKQKYLFLATSSGDIGASLKAFENLPNVEVLYFYPKNGISNIQTDQLEKLEGKNIKVFAVNSNFRSIQNNMKTILKSNSIESQFKYTGSELSTVNSMNFGTIIFQIVYNFWSYLKMVSSEEIKCGEKITYFVPTGNIGDALGLFYAKMMGLPIEKIVLCSNENNILTCFIHSGIYDSRNKDLVNTSSISMNVLISQNIERILFHFFGPVRTRELMNNLEQNGFFQINSIEHKAIKNIFKAQFAKEFEIEDRVKRLFESNKYLVSPNTSAACVSRSSFKAIKGKTIVLSTVSWAKTPEYIANIFDCNPDFDSLHEKLGIEIPLWVTELNNKKINHYTTINSGYMKSEVLNFLK